MKKLYYLILLALILALVLTGCFSKPTTEFAVTSVTASVDDNSYTSPPSAPCGKTFNFSAVITVNGLGTVTYRWEWSDGFSDGFTYTKSITFAAAGSQTVTDSLSLVASYFGRMRVHILTPNDTLSNSVYFQLSCFGW